uniref:Transcription elongation factor GreA n=1 Tax=Desulfacinum infernum TaxID=35837 RepID=A0A831ZNR4_9BACT
MEKVPITRQGFRNLNAQLLYLRRVVRPRVLEELQEARLYGVKVDNQQYLLAREQHRVLQRKIDDLQAKIAQCEIVVGRKFLVRQVAFGTDIVVLNVDTGQTFRFQMVGPFESDVRNGKLSVDSPVGRSLMGRFPGEEITVLTPAGERTYRILQVDV